MANPSEIDTQIEAASSVQLKISTGMELLKDKQINNLILREGYPIEGEMVLNGEVAIMECHEAVDTGAIDGNILSRDELKALAYLISPDWEQEIRKGGMDGIFPGDSGGRYRANIFLWGGKPQNINDHITGRLGCMIRVIPDKVPGLDTLGLPPYMRGLADANYGLLLVLGPTGAGKTTTVASYIEHINQTRVGHIIKIEDPIEYLHKEDKCRISPREIGSNVANFETGVKDAMRELPLAISVGEIRNQETLVHTLRAAHSGHYVTATRHAPNLISGIRALVDDMPGDSRANSITVSETLLGVVFQVCVPGMDNRWHYVHEVMNVTHNDKAKECIAQQNWAELRELLRPPARASEARMAQSLNENLAKLVIEGKISSGAADRRAYDRPGLIQNINALKAASR